MKDYRVSDLSDLKDNELAQLAQQGVEPAFEVLKERHQTRLDAYARRKFDMSHEDAEEVTLDAFMNAWNGLKNWEPRGPFEAWLITIMRNACHDHLKKEKNRRKNLPTESLDDPDNSISEPACDRRESDPVQELIQQEREEEIKELFRSELSRGQRCAAWLVWIEEMTMREAAAVMRIAEGTVKAHLSRARTKLRAYFRQLRNQE